jgi:hypothetical protein
MRVAIFTLFFALFINNAKAQDCDIATTGVGIVNATNTVPVGSITVGQTANFKFVLYNAGTDLGCTIPANTVSAFFDFPTMSGGIKPYKYDGPLSFVSGYFTWNYNSAAEVLIGTNTTAIPNGMGDANILVKVLGNAVGSGSSNLNITQGFGVTDNPGNNFSGAQLIINASTVNIVCPGSVAIFTAPAGGGSYQWQVDAGSGFVNMNNDGVCFGTGTNILNLTNAPTSWYGYKYQCMVSSGPGSPHTNPVTLKFSLTWTGAADNTWENPLNWSCFFVPDNNTDVMINNGAPLYPQVNSNASCRSLTVQTGASILVKPGFNMNITGKSQ